MCLCLLLFFQLSWFFFLSTLRTSFLSFLLAAFFLCFFTYQHYSLVWFQALALSFYTVLNYVFLLKWLLCGCFRLLPALVHKQCRLVSVVFLFGTLCNLHLSQASQIALWASDDSKKNILTKHISSFYPRTEFFFRMFRVMLSRSLLSLKRTQQICQK